jgi:hypothetical protein
MWHARPKVVEAAATDRETERHPSFLTLVVYGPVVLADRRVCPFPIHTVELPSRVRKNSGLKFTNDLLSNAAGRFFVQTFEHVG